MSTFVHDIAHVLWFRPVLDRMLFVSAFPDERLTETCEQLQSVSTQHQTRPEGACYAISLDTTSYCPTTQQSSWLILFKPRAFPCSSSARRPQVAEVAACLCTSIIATLMSPRRSSTCCDNPAPCTVLAVIRGCKVVTKPLLCSCIQASTNLRACDTPHIPLAKNSSTRACLLGPSSLGSAV